MSNGQTRLSVATLNTWHGLDGKGKVFFGGLESRRERMARLERQLNCLKVVDADILLLQEVNPLPFRAHWYANELRRRCFYAPANSGVKLGWGPPSNLNEGLAILLPFDWEVEFLGKKRLSGRFRMTPFTLSEVSGAFLSLQLHESRMGLALRVELPPERCLNGFPGAQTFIFAVTHLHHAPSLTPRNRALLEEAVQSGLSKEEEEHILRCFRIANNRRLNEFDNLITWLESLRRPGEPIVLGGDFNCEPDSAPIAGLLRRGWLDAWQYAQNPDSLVESATWDPPRNPLAYRSQEFHHTGGRFSTEANALLQQTDALARRIDYLFVYPWKSAEALQGNEPLSAAGSIRSVHRFGFLQGNPLTSESLVVDDYSELQKTNEFTFEGVTDDNFVSDHYGLIARFG